MKLRNHPLMRHRGASNWPPTWMQHRRDGGVKTLQGEIGVLRYAYSRRGPAEKCYLVIEHEHEAFVGTLFFDNETSCEQICKLLQAHVGHSIKEIGDLEV